MTNIKTLEISSLQECLQALQSAETLRSSVEEIQRSLDSQITEVSKQADSLLLAESLRQSNWLSEAVNQANLCAQALRDIAKPYRPAIEQIGVLSAQLAIKIQPFSSVVRSIAQWEQSLAARMNYVKSPWVLPENFEQSLIGFARLSRLSDAVHTLEPYSPSVSELVAEEIGEGILPLPDSGTMDPERAAVEAGLNPQLISFPPDAFGQVVLAAGFRFSFTPTPVPQPLGFSDSGAVIDPQHWQIMNELERSLRSVIEEQLGKLSGSNWIKQRVPQAVHERWKARREENRDNRRTVYPLIHYADFMDLADLIVQSNNWRDAFESIFKNREDFQVSMRRLHPLRKAFAHARPLSRSDVLILFSEATRIFGALGIHFLS